MALVYLSLGSNLGNREKFLEDARQAILGEFSSVRFSKVYETEPVEYLDQPWFLNQVVELKTEKSPETLLEWTQQLEKSMGRQREIPKGPRTLDVDILLYEQMEKKNPALQLPHPGLVQRRHVLVPLAELAPQLVLPGNVLVKDALEKLKDSAQVRPYAQS